MEILNQYNEQVAAFAARVFLGLLFFFQGRDVIFKIGVKTVINTYQYDFANKGIPKFMTSFALVFNAYVQLIGGLLLIVGLFQYPALYLLALHLLITAFGFSFNEAMWDVKHVWPRFVLILFLLAIPSSWQKFSLDYLIINP